MSKIIQQLLLQIQILKIQIEIFILRKKRTVPNLGSPNRIIVHHSAGGGNFKQVNEWHRQKWGFKSSLGYYAGYTYYIEPDGKVIQARSDSEEGAHTRGFNKRTIGICLQGDGTKEDFTMKQYEALEELVEKKKVEYGITKLQPHSAFANTLCPSDYLRDFISHL